MLKMTKSQKQLRLGAVAPQDLAIAFEWFFLLVYKPSYLDPPTHIEKLGFLQLHGPV